MAGVVFDIEANGFWPAATQIWLICTEDPETGETRAFSDHDPDLPSLKEGLAFLSKQEALIGHNIAGYDIPVLEWLLDWKPAPSTKIQDTWVISQVLRYKRPHMHGLEGWGSFFGFPKIRFDKFDKYSKEMLEYCKRDVSLNVKVYNHLLGEFRSTYKINPMIRKGLEVECKFAQIEADIRFRGWNFDAKACQKLITTIEKRVKEIEAEIEPQMGLVCLSVDPKDNSRVPAYKKDGELNLITCKYWGLDAAALSQILTPDAAFCRVSFEPARLGSDKALKSWLFKKGWVPDDWNIERIKGKVIRKSPKLTDSSLQFLGRIGEMISEYNTITNRLGVLRSWLVSAETDGRLHGKMWTVGTPTFRCRHEVIANLPTQKVAYGPEMRALLKPQKGWVLVGADSAGNQMRALCHDVGNDEFTHEVINGDVHTKNLGILDEFIPRNVTEPAQRRDRAKRFLYAYLFGAGPEKLSLILADVRDKGMGEAATQKFMKGIVGLDKLKATLEKSFDATRSRFGDDNSFIRGVDGRIIFVKSRHQLLNYRLQSIEGITCKAAAVYFKEKAAEIGLQYNFLLHYHDEIAIECPLSEATRAKELAAEAFREAPKWFGIECMDGEAKIGHNYAEVH
jgi:hypothetical protein